jgi:UDP-N-acetylglucosamine 2-epimerase (non-hydrolysing)
LLDDPAEYARRSRIHNPFGDGHASERIAGVLARQT